MARREWEIARFEIAGATAVFTGRLGGHSAAPWDSFNLADHVGDDPGAVMSNRLELAAEIGLSGLVGMEQVHGADVVRVGAVPSEGPPIGRGPACDGLTTGITNLGLMALAADCVPLAIAGPQAVAAVHAGWRGIAAGVVGNAVEAVAASDGGPIEAAVGPSARACCYEVGVEVMDALGVEASAGTGTIDLQEQVTTRLRALGVEIVGTVDRCTICDPALFSHRAGGPQTGRQGVIAWLNS